MSVVNSIPPQEEDSTTNNLKLVSGYCVDNGYHEPWPGSHVGAQTTTKTRWVARGTPTPATNLLRLARKDGQPRAHQLLLLSHVGV